ncbi:hypothetical protein HLB44_15930 [Aquincola sp. S2]|uniref:Uncharacterized protein n=1 Tax=Pseudaquabacterium terrae TaxID=2732868 RepID=A0ABX2EIT9_9BURK|nr:hypothetical protein [Aquabacterium terrae]NRF68484.1 hypothetical protein [Aquabacterium terrae]
MQTAAAAQQSAELDGATNDNNKVDTDGDDGGLDLGKGRMKTQAGDDQQDMADQSDAGAGQREASLERLVRWKRETWDGKPRPPMEVRVGPARAPGAEKKTAMQLSASRAPGAAALFGPSFAAPRDAKQLLRAYTSVLMSVAHNPAAAGQAQTASSTLAASRACLERLPADVESLTVGDVKLMLMEVSDELQHTPGRPPRDDSEPAQNARLMLLLKVLNCTRPRTPTQLADATSRLRLAQMTRGLG